MDGNDIAYLEHLEFMTDGKDDLLDSLVQRNFFLEFQPITNLSPAKIIGFEALLRLSSVKGPLSASSFVPIAERNGAMDPIGFWALEEASNAVHQLCELYGNEAPFMSVNLSGLQLELKNFPDKFEGIVDQSDINTEKLVFDIDQSTFMSKRPNIVHNILYLRERGHQIHLDGFDPKYLPKDKTLLYQLIDAVKWPIATNYIWHLGKKLSSAFEEIADELGEHKIKIIFHKIDHNSHYNDLCTLCTKHMGQGFILGSPMGLESSLKIYNRYQKGG